MCVRVRVCIIVYLCGGGEVVCEGCHGAFFFRFEKALIHLTDIAREFAVVR
jgi:hypothetical protein